MQKLKHTMILSGAKGEVATLTIEKKLNGVFGTIKTYNLNITENLILGLHINDKILKQNVMLNANNTYTFKLKENDFVSCDACVLVYSDNGKYVPIMWCKNKYFYDEILAEFNSVYVPNSIVTSQTVEIKNNKAELFESDDEEIENIIDKELEGVNDFENDEIEEKDIFYEENKKLKDLDNNEFFELISEQIDDLFDNYPRVDELEELISNSKWVKIDFENNGNEYVLGLIYQDFDLKYICYGVPGVFGSVPPKQLGKCQWLPLNPQNPENGYWVIYQDASTGEKVDAI